MTKRICAAIDVGSNGIRLSIVRRVGGNNPPWKESVRQRRGIRLGADVFTRGRISNQAMGDALDAFRDFRDLFDQYKVGDNYRAVATSAMRDARNSEEFVALIKEKTKLRLQIIDGLEEARLTTTAINRALPGKADIIFDLGGGSLQVNFKDKELLSAPVSLPLGTVRLMEQFDLSGAIHRHKIFKLEVHLLDALEKAFPVAAGFKGALVAASGGNAEDLARLAAGGKEKDIPILDVQKLKKLLPELLKLEVFERQIKYTLERNRAEVIGIAGVTILSLATVLGIKKITVPGVGVREGLLWDLIES